MYSSRQDVNNVYILPATIHYRLSRVACTRAIWVEKAILTLSHCVLHFPQYRRIIHTSTVDVTSIAPHLVLLLCQGNRLYSASQMYLLLQKNCSLCYNPTGIIKKRKKWDHNDEAKATTTLSMERPSSGRSAWLHYSYPHCSTCHPGKLPGWEISYTTFVCTARAAVWPDLGDTRSISFIHTHTAIGPLRAS